ncbi:AMP-binding protein [Pseudomonas sp. 18175]|uniref:AMP-binding protein n=1 Tax=Pseudomonas sp. 18175 TaxID=3390056 RepID=UPI003D20DBCB
MLLETLASRMATGEDRIAICSSTQQITYAELYERATVIAHALQECPLRQGALVAICMERSPALLVAIVGVMLAGAAYTVVEARAPTRRAGAHDAVLDTIQRINPDLILVDRGDSPWYSYTTPSLVIPKPSAGTTPQVSVITPVQSAAYVLFTSGTSGLSKGVEISHASLTHYCRSMVERLGLPEGLRYAHVSPLSADLGNTSLFLALWTGGSVFLADEQERQEPLQLAKALVAQQVDCLKCTPTQWRLLYPALLPSDPAQPVLQWLILGGERLSAQLARETLAEGLAANLANHYGPTETTIGATVQPVTLALLEHWGAGWVPIGRPLGDNRALIRTDEYELVKASAGQAQGELYLSGPGLALGYRGLPDETRARFIEPRRKHQRAYRTGDRVRVDQDGVLHFLGRTDRQVKINGYRVELESVERSIVLEGVRDVRVVQVCQDHRNLLLCAYEGEAALASALREQMLSVLPMHMVPVGFLAINPLPITDNGKLDDAQIRQQLIAHFVKPAWGEAEHSLESEVQRLFALYLPGSAPGLDGDFFALGGDSLGAIQLITELQLRGYTFSVQEFFADPTVRAVTERLIHQPPQQTPAAEPLATGPWPCSPAQQAFFARDLAEPNRWTQVLVLDLEPRLDEAVLQRALAALMTAHPLLSARFAPDEPGPGWCFHLNSEATPLFDVVQLPKTTLRTLERAVADAYAWIEARLDVREGRVFGAVLLQQRRHSALLLVAHHLVVDVVSWHVLQKTLLRLCTEPLPAVVRSFGGWKRSEPLARSGVSVPPPVDDTGFEGQAQSVWIKFTEWETRQLREQARQLGLKHIDRLLLSAYAQACAALSGEQQVCIDVETHGRLEDGGDTDLCSQVGWFTTTVPITLRPLADADEALPIRVEQALSPSANVPAVPCAAPYCFNVIGSPPCDASSTLAWTPLAVTLPSLRGAFNRRSHVLHLTARVLDQQWVIDLNYPTPRYAPAAMRRFAHDLRRRLLARQGRDVSLWDRQPPLMSTANSAGVLWSVPQGLDALRPPLWVKPPACVLLTGANGFLGIHVLAALLEQPLLVICLVRDRHGVSAGDRLRTAWEAFFPDREWPAQWVRVWTGNLEQPRLGLEASQWTLLVDTLDGIYHLAADTHLVGNDTDTVEQALTPLRELVALARQGRGKTLHFTSTLAIAGTNVTTQRFCEDSYNIGQTFLNGYERSKYAAEAELRDFTDSGGRAFIYRCGTLTGQACSGRFQRNARDSRSVQSLRALLQVGAMPAGYDEPLAWTAVDEVARALAMLSRDPTLDGGTYHLEAPTCLSLTQLRTALARRGVSLGLVPAASLRELFQQSGQMQDAEVALGHFWASRPPRNVQFDHQNTLALLADKGMRFSALDEAWLDRFLDHLFASGALPRPQQGARP